MSVNRGGKYNISFNFSKPQKFIQPDDILDISKIPTIAEYGPALHNNQMEESNDRISCKTLDKAKYRWKFDTTTILIFLLILSNATQLAFYNNSQTQGQLHN